MVKTAKAKRVDASVMLRRRQSPNQPSTHRGALTRRYIIALRFQSSRDGQNSSD
jgi:hypothetical protein